MPARLISRTPNDALASKRGVRASYVILGVLCAACVLLAAGYHILLWSTGEPASSTVEFVYHIVVLTGYGLLWSLMMQRFRRRATSPARIFWTTLLAGAFFLALGHFTTRLGRPLVNLDVNPAVDVLGFDLETGVPLALATVFKTNVLAFIETVFAFLILLRFRDLVLVKRTKSSQRNWYLMLGFMTVAALFGFMKSPSEELNLFQRLIVVPAVVLMVVNSLRLSWIVFLSFREKMASIGLVLLLLILLLSVGSMDQSLLPGFDLVPGAYVYLRHFSYPLAVFSSLAIIFGILYCTTAFLSLLFHLPTTSDFQRKAGEMATVHSLSHLVSQVFDSEKLYSSIAAAPIEACSANTAWLAVPDPHSGTLRPRIVSTNNIEAERVEALVDTKALFDEVAGTREPLLLPQAPADHRIDARPGDGISSLLVVPLVARDLVLGALFATKEVAHGFEPDDVEAISVFAAQAALAIDNARLFEEQLEKERLARELSIAREVQRKLLPQHLPVLEGVTLAASSVSALEVGGDYYDFVRLDEDRLAVIVGDVSGKGTSAAFYMAEMQGIFQALSRLTPSPSEFLVHANVALADSLERNVFISVIYGVLDLEKEEFVLARAGHCPAAVISLSGAARYLRSQGLGLGLDRGALFGQTLAEERIRLQPGDVFVLYTDGVVESRSPDGEEYGYERLLRVLRENRHEDAPDLHATLLADLHTFMGNQEYDDDMTLVVLKWHGIPLPQARTSAQHAAIPLEAVSLGADVLGADVLGADVLGQLEQEVRPE